MSKQLLSLIFAGLLACIFLKPVETRADFPILIVKASDTIAVAGTQAFSLPIYMQNFEDIVAAFTLKIYTDHPDVIQFYPGCVDKSGTLTANWQYVTSIDDGINGTRIIAMANIPDTPYVSGIGYPQYGEIPLIKLLFNIAPTLPDTMSSPIIDIKISHDPQKFNFSDEMGNTIGLGYNNPTFDTLYYNCMEWGPEPGGDSSCLLWEEVMNPPADTMVIDTILHPYLDTSIVHIFDGSVIIQGGICVLMGDVDNNGIINIFDITTLIAHLYSGGPELDRPAHADVNCDCVVNIFDITCLITSIYSTGSPCDMCDCIQWEQSCGE
jgi:hypothetical protein